MTNLLKKSTNISQDILDAVLALDSRSLRKFPPRVRRQVKKLQSNLGVPNPLAKKSCCLRGKLPFILIGVGVLAIVAVSLYFFLKDDEDDFDFELDI